MSQRTLERRLFARHFEFLLHDNPAFSSVSAGLGDREGKLGCLTRLLSRRSKGLPSCI